jgi:hypothetical protein
VESGDTKAEKTAVEMAANCHSGRLIAWDKATGKPLNEDQEPSIALVEGPKEGMIGPLWVRGGVPLYAADGSLYEVRNRMTLCRCGRSRNKPFCDGTHMR